MRKWFLPPDRPECDNLASRPNFIHCEPVDSGVWYRQSSSGSAYSYGAGVKFKSVIGIDLSSARQYSTSNRLVYKIAGTKRMCGSNSDPSVARTVMEKHR